MEKYDFKALEKKYADLWKEEGVYEPDFEHPRGRGKFYNLMMFPYPSAEGLHVGNMYAFTGSDVYGRMKRMQGYDVFEPIGLDGFGIHSENYALKIGAHPMDQAEKSEKNFYKQLQIFGNGFAWNEKVETYAPDYYKWTQWLFLEMWKAGLAYRKKQSVNWCPSCKTVLADEQVISGKCERCSSVVEKRDLEQWFFRITKYSDKLLSNLENMDWSERVKIAQKNWIGKSEGASIKFKVAIPTGRQESEKLKVSEIEVFTTRPDTIFGATFLVISPELADEWIKAGRSGSEESSGSMRWGASNEVKKYIEDALLRRGKEGYEEKEKTGVFSGINAINPATKEEIPIWISDYVLAGYGTGAIMAVPAHDGRDFDFAKKFNLPVKVVIVDEKPKYFIFDFDGVIADTFEAAKQALLRTGEVKSIEEAEAFWKKYFNSKPNHVRGHSLPDSEMKRLDEVTGKFGKEILDIGFKLFDNFVEEIKAIPNAKIAVISRGAGIYVKKKMQESGIKTTHVLAWEDHHSKEEKIEKVCADWGIPVNEVYYFTDSKADVYELENHMDRKKIIGCAWGFCGYESLLEVLPENQILKEEKDLNAFCNGLFEGEGELINSGKFDGMNSEEAGKKITKFVGGKIEIKYRLRDWLVSRQRYWGAPIPMIFCEACANSGKGEHKDMLGWYAVSEKDLPVVLPRVEDFRPKGTGMSPLASVKEFYEVKCPNCGGEARRETDVSDTFLDSAWYYLRYLDAQNIKEAFDKKRSKKWLPIDMYIGGAEHAVLHLLYIRFVAIALKDMGHITFEEPAQKFRAHGLLIKDGAKMSKSKGNVINPDEYIARFGADAFRMYLMFLAPFEEGGDFRDEGLLGPARFLERVWKASKKVKSHLSAQAGKLKDESKNLERSIHKTIKKVTEDIESLHYNTAISSLMVLLNEFEKEQEISRSDFSSFLKLIAPFAPFLTDSLWREVLGESESIHKSVWPEYDKELIKEDSFILVIQVNGKMRGQIEVEAGISKKDAQALAEKEVGKLISAGVKKVIYVKGRLINFVV